MPRKWERPNINVNVYVFSLISHRVQQTSQFTPLVFLTISYTVSSPLSTANAFHNAPLSISKQDQT